MKKVLNLLLILSFILITIFPSPLLVHAQEVDGTILNDEVRLRTGAGTNTGIITTMSKNTKVKVLDTTAKKGTGCSTGWYQIRLNNTTGYVCGEYLSIAGIGAKYSYSRPWTSPKKAIYGGAEFIASGYISSGQNTSYLKKFNVNPASAYSKYTHQYMANLSAPYSEAYSAYKSYKDNGLINLALHFAIPLYVNMPSKTSHPVSGEEKGGTSTVKDKTFEDALNRQGFDETYKIWLRAIHEQHPNWTFEAIHTGLDFNVSVANEKYASSIYYTCSACREQPNQMTEKNWYIANNQTVAYFLDPRNFLDETSILMFEDLSFSEYYKEDAVKSVLKGTFMEGTDPIDHQSYSSIFYEAGKIYNVSPIYLASLSKQEVGVRGSITTSGEQFSYKGITYEGFYNFYNIGAYSSEENPAKAGLVYAALGGVKNEKGIYVGNVGGTPEISPGVDTTKPTPQPTPTQTETPKEETPKTQENKTEQSNTTASQLSNLNLNKKNTYVTNLSINMRASTLLNKENTIKIKDASGKEMNGNTVIGTGSTISFVGGETLTTVLYGDLNGDGVINSGDILKMRQHLLGQIKLEGAYLEAAHVKTLTGNINSGDLLILRQHLLGQIKIDQS